MFGRLLPGIILPGLIYFVVSRRAPVLVALAAASSVPLLDTIARLVRGKRPSAVSLFFVGFAGISVALAAGLRSPMFILARGAVWSAVMGTAFSVSAVIRRPLTRTLAIFLLAETVVGRKLLAERWKHPKAVAIFRTLSVGWGVLLLLMAVQQLALVLTVSPGTVMATEPAIQALVTILGTAASITYVRRFNRTHPQLSLFPAASQP